MADDLKQGVVARIKIIAPQVAELDDETLAIFADDALEAARADGFPETALRRAASYLAAHYAYVAFNQNAHVKKEAAAVLSREYFEAQGTDDYLMEYQRLRASEGSGTNIARFI